MILTCAQISTGFEPEQHSVPTANVTSVPDKHAKQSYVGKSPSTVVDDTDDDSILEEFFGAKDASSQSGLVNNLRQTHSLDALQEVTRQNWKQYIRCDELAEQNHDNQLKEAMWTIEELQDKLNKSESMLREKERLIIQKQRQIDLLRLAKKQRDRNSGGAYEQLIEEKDQQIQTLARRLGDRETLGSFTKTRASLERFEKESVTYNFREAHFAAQEFTGRHSLSEEFSIPDLERYPELKRLICNALGIDQNARIPNTAHIETALSELTPQAILRAVSSSALTKWVYETEYPAMDSGSSKLLEAYRRQLLTQGT